MLVCSLCDFKAFSKGNLTFHLSSVHFKDKEYICRLCHFKTAYKGALTRHVNTVHLRQCKTKECPICGYTTPSLLNLNSHLSSEHHLEIATAFAKPNVSRVRNAAQIQAEEVAKHQLQMQEEEQRRRQREQQAGQEQSETVTELQSVEQWQEEEERLHLEKRVQHQLGEQPLNLMRTQEEKRHDHSSSSSSMTTNHHSKPLHWETTSHRGYGEHTQLPISRVGDLVERVSHRRRKTLDPVRIAASSSSSSSSFSEGEWALVKQSYETAMLLQQHQDDQRRQQQTQHRLGDGQQEQ